MVNFPLVSSCFCAPFRPRILHEKHTFVWKQTAIFGIFSRKWMNETIRQTGIRYLMVGFLRLYLFYLLFIVNRMSFNFCKQVTEQSVFPRAKIIELCSYFWKLIHSADFSAFVVKNGRRRNKLSFISIFD